MLTYVVVGVERQYYKKTKLANQLCSRGPTLAREAHEISKSD